MKALLLSLTAGAALFIAAALLLMFLVFVRIFSQQYALANGNAKAYATGVAAGSIVGGAVAKLPPPLGPVIAFANQLISLIGTGSFIGAGNR